MFELTYDYEADAMYIRLTDKEVFRTLALDDGTNVDYDKFGGVIGIEVLSPDRSFK